MGSEAKKKEKKISENGKMPKQRRRDRKWERLDNTANLFPAIAGEEMTNTYRWCVVFNDPIDPKALQEAVDILTPKIPGFNLRLRNGAFWFYLEEIHAPAPRVKEEAEYPCRLIHGNRNDQYMFRVTYFKNRINIECFHAIADGTGIIIFGKELVYQYLRCAHPDLREKYGDKLSPETFIGREDSFLKNFKKNYKIEYSTKRAYLLHGERLPYRAFGVTLGIISLKELKAMVKSKYDMTLNDYLVACFIYAIYKTAKGRASKKRPIKISVPVDLRPFFGSMTTKNFFCMVSAEFAPEKEDYTFEEVAKIIHDDLKKKITKENLESIFSFTVSYTQMFVAKIIPLFFKNMAMKIFYLKAAKSNTSTITNIGNMKLDSPYDEYVKFIYCFLPFSAGQRMKGTITSFKDTMVYAVGSAYKDTSVQREIYRQIANDGVNVTIETNGVFYE